MRRDCFVAALLATTSLAVAAPDPLSLAAEYYFVRHDYRQALELWSTALKRQPDNLAAVLRVAELRLLFQGRPASRDALLTFLDAGPRPAEARRAVEEKLAQLQSTFLTDDGQSAYFQALPKVRAGECEAALPLLAQAVSLEKGNLRALKEKAACERTLGRIDRSYASLQQALDLNPFTPETLEALAEAHVYFRVPAKVIELFRRPGIGPRTPRQRTALGVALAETGAVDEAVALLLPLAQDKTRTAHPVVAWALGTALAARGDAAAESTSFLEAFLLGAARPESALVDGWDPYRIAERTEAAGKLVATLKGN